MEDKFNMRHFRQLLSKFTKEELANKLNLSLEKISELEKNSEEIALGMRQKIVSLTGNPIEKSTSSIFFLSRPFEVEDTWKSTNDLKRNVLRELEQADKDNVENVYLNEIRESIFQTIVKPSVAVVGMSDAGKSTLINTLLGEDKLPTAWTPTTSISVHIKHISDRPDFIKDEVWVFKGDTTGFDFKKVDDESYALKMKMAGGKASILSRFGVRQTENQETEEEPVAAVIYIDSPILKVCDIVDLPGFGTGDRKNDDILAQKSKEFADIIIYLSIANGFLRGTDIEFIKAALNGLPTIENKKNGLKPLNNFFVLASQSHTVDNGNLIELDRILDKGADRLYNLTPEEIWGNKQEQSGYDYTLETIRTRFFTYSKEDRKVRERFEHELRVLLEQLPLMLQQQGFDTIQANSNRIVTNIENQISVQKDILLKRDEYVARLNDLKKNEKAMREYNEQSRKLVLKLISVLKKQSIDEFKAEYDTLVNVKNIEMIIDDKGYRNKKEDIEFLAGYLTSKIQMRLQETLKNKSKILTNEITEYLKEFEIQVNKYDKGPSNIQIPFDTLRIFASGLAGAAALGGLAIWASALGNLGAYILVAKGVSVLSAIGIGFSGGVAGAVAGVAAIGGPLVIGIALAAIVSMSVYAMFSGGKRKVAKGLVNSFEKEKAVIQFTQEIIKFWDETEEAFNTAADHLENEWMDSINSRANMVLKYDKTEIENSINELERIKQMIKKLNFSLPVTLPNTIN